MKLSIALDSNPMHKKALIGLHRAGGTMTIADFDATHAPHGQRLRGDLAPSLISQSSETISLTPTGQAAVQHDDERIVTIKESLRKMIPNGDPSTIDTILNKSIDVQADVRDLEDVSDDFFFNSYAISQIKFLSYIPPRVLNDDSRVLDLGSSVGRSLFTLNRAFGMKGWGVDKFAMVQSSDFHRSRSVKVADLYARHNVSIISPFDIERQPLPYQDDHFDLVICQQTIEHLHNSPKFVLDEALKVLRPGGALLIDTPNIAYYQNRLALLRGQTVHWDLKLNYNHGLSHEGVFYGHIREFTLGELKQMLTWTGFEIELAETAFYEPPPTPVDTLTYLTSEIAKYLAEIAGEQAATVFSSLRSMLLQRPQLLSTFGQDQLATMAPCCVILGRKT